MRIGELSERTGVPAPTIKYYVREGLLPPGTRTSPNQAGYGPGHERRLRLVRALVEIGGLPIAKVREVLAGIDAPERPLDSALGVVARALEQAPAQDGRAGAEARRETDGIARERGWDTRAQESKLETLAGLLETFRELGQEDLAALVGPYAEAARLVAEADIAALQARSGRDETLETMIIGMVLGDALFRTLRRLEQTRLSGERFG
ncbi:MerR family transcriptional regulator [Actinomadura macrotermitis]|uniref:HTH merR-type domain-containing protein n=1 Tax=Actinomadura macrotermitis TaxID=2585200 RepID=A0A7K0BW66_9ACTN|nr:MerR family transcriptional regulator [Actinomadura macrotermitis]MQY05420.1 hypothetical protein [Actinomadura macrotermitis]